jgi:Ca2+-binding EF-hand superfamily protein
LSLDEFKADKTRRAMASKAELIFNAKDVNKDKKLSLQEFAAAQSFEEMKVLYDKDKDGSVTLEEYLAGRKGKTDSAKKVFEARDKNKDGKWTAEDFVQKKAGKKKAKRAAR